jgi:hypothetical protein
MGGMRRRRKGGRVNFVFPMRQMEFVDAEATAFLLTIFHGIRKTL